MLLTERTLARAAHIPRARARKWVDLLNEYLPRYGINSSTEVATFLAQMGHESVGFKRLVENLNYSVEGLANTWPRHFRNRETYRPNALAQRYGRSYHRQANRQMIANIAYGNRMGNGDVESGDGYRYRGRGIIMLTGKYNYQKFSDHIGQDFVLHPDRVKDPEYALLSACWFWRQNNLDRVDDDLSQMAETRIINGGLIGIRDRERRFSIAHAALTRSMEVA